jgi:hypothetical protein
MVQRFTAGIGFLSIHLRFLKFLALLPMEPSGGGKSRFPMA